MLKPLKKQGGLMEIENDRNYFDVYLGTAILQIYYLICKKKKKNTKYRWKCLTSLMEITSQKEVQ